MVKLPQLSKKNAKTVKDFQLKSFAVDSYTVLYGKCMVHKWVASERTIYIIPTYVIKVNAALVKTLSYLCTVLLYLCIINIFTSHVMTPHIHDMNIYHDIHKITKHITTIHVVNVNSYMYDK